MFPRHNKPHNEQAYRVKIAKRTHENPETETPEVEVMDVDSEPRIDPFFKKAQESREQLVKLMRTKKHALHKSLIEPRKQLIEASMKVFLLDIELASRHSLDQVVWKLVYYCRIDELRKNLRSAAEVYGATRAQSANEKYKIAQKMLFSVIEEARRFYDSLISQLQAAFKLSLDGPVSQKTWKEATTEVKAAYIACQKCYVLRGDIERYSEQHSDSRDKNWELAKSFYVQARGIYPSEGNPHNQLAVIATHEGSIADAMFHYYSALSCRNPFRTAGGNLDLVFDKARSMVESGSWIGGSDSGFESSIECLCEALDSGDLGGVNEALQYSKFGKGKMKMKMRKIKPDQESTPTATTTANVNASMRKGKRPSSLLYEHPQLGSVNVMSSTKISINDLWNVVDEIFGPFFVYVHRLMNTDESDSDSEYIFSLCLRLFKSILGSFERCKLTQSKSSHNRILMWVMKLFVCNVYTVSRSVGLSVSKVSGDEAQKGGSGNRVKALSFCYAFLSIISNIQLDLLRKPSSSSSSHTLYLAVLNIALEWSVGIRGKNRKYTTEVDEDDDDKLWKHLHSALSFHTTTTATADFGGESESVLGFWRNLIELGNILTSKNIKSSSEIQQFSASDFEVEEFISGFYPLSRVSISTPSPSSASSSSMTFSGWFLSLLERLSHSPHSKFYIGDDAGRGGSVKYHLKSPESESFSQSHVVIGVVNEEGKEEEEDDDDDMEDEVILFQPAQSQPHSKNGAHMNDEEEEEDLGFLVTPLPGAGVGADVDAGIDIDIAMDQSKPNPTSTSAATSASASKMVTSSMKMKMKMKMKMNQGEPASDKSGGHGRGRGHRHADWGGFGNIGLAGELVSVDDEFGAGGQERDGEGNSSSHSHSLVTSHKSKSISRQETDGQSGAHTHTVTELSQLPEYPFAPRDRDRETADHTDSASAQFAFNPHSAPLDAFATSNLTGLGLGYDHIGPGVPGRPGADVTSASAASLYSGYNYNYNQSTSTSSGKSKVGEGEGEGEGEGKNATAVGSSGASSNVGGVGGFNLMGAFGPTTTKNPFVSWNME